MVFYLSPYASETESKKRGLFFSAAANNRIKELTHVFKQLEDVIVVSCALPDGSVDCENTLYMDEHLGTQVFYPKASRNTPSKTMILECIYYLRKNLKKGDVIVVYNAHFIRSLILWGIGLFRRKNYRLIYEIEELYSVSGYYGRMKKNLLRLCEFDMNRRCDGVISVNTNLLRGRISKKGSIISYGYDLFHDQYSSGFKSNKNEKIVAYSGRLDRDGGVDLLLEALNEIKTACSVIITGSGELETQVKEFKPNNPLVKLIYKGFVSQAELERIMNEADVCVSTLDPNREFARFSFPSKVYMYLSFGNIVVSSNVESVCDLNNDFPNIIIYDKQTPNDLCKAIEKGLIYSEKWDKVRAQLNFVDNYRNRTENLLKFMEKQVTRKR